MLTIGLLLAGTLLTAPQERPAIPDYFEGGGAAGQPENALCNLNDEAVDGPLKTCRYDCGQTLTIDTRLACPFVLQR